MDGHSGAFFHTDGAAHGQGSTHWSPAQARPPKDCLPEGEDSECEVENTIIAFSTVLYCIFSKTIEMI